MGNSTTQANVFVTRLVLIVASLSKVIDASLVITVFNKSVWPMLDAEQHITFASMCAVIGWQEPSEWIIGW
jgi:3-deoxy-D-arabino-heptulosonate 7-phosphate (DAHP) synthase